MTLYGKLLCILSNKITPINILLKKEIYKPIICYTLNHTYFNHKNNSQIIFHMVYSQSFIENVTVDLGMKLVLLFSTMEYTLDKRSCLLLIHLIIGMKANLGIWCLKNIFFLFSYNSLEHLFQAENISFILLFFKFHNFLSFCAARYMDQKQKLNKI